MPDNELRAAWRTVCREKSYAVHNISRLSLAIACLMMVLCSATAAHASMQGQNEITVDPKILQQYVGTYELAPNFSLMVTLVQNQLMVQASGQAALPVYAGSETKFFYKVVDAQIEFFKNDKGEVDRLVLYQNQREMPGKKISSTVAQRKEIAVPAKILEQYVGTYELQPGAEVTITLEGNQLMTQITGQPRFPLFAESGTKFFLKVVDAQVEFIKNDAGAVTDLVIHQGPAEIKARRK